MTIDTSARLGSNADTLESQPHEFVLQGQFAPDWEVVRPLVAKERVDTDGSYLVSESIFPVHGVGDTSEAARKDFAESLADLYRFWESDAAHGSEGAEEAFAWLREYVRPVSQESAPDAV
jgi:hypothetical protein